MDAVRKYMSEAKTPTLSDRVYKDECAYSFDTSESEDGLYVSLNSFVGVGKRHLPLYCKKSNLHLFLHIKTTKVPKEPEENPPKRTPTKVAIGVEGGFDANEEPFELVHTHSLAVYESAENIQMFALPNTDIPELVQMSIAGVIAADSGVVADDAKAWEAAREESRFAKDLVQLSNGVKIPPKGWKCSQCELTDNLWLNLSDGAVNCGRKQIGGLDGNGHALQHYKDTNFPLCVKLGTITPEGADVFSYAEDDMVLDPLLAKHLSHFGINMMQMEKTTVSTTELELKANESLRFEMDRIQESGKTLTPLNGPGYTGLRNLGNTCYMNSVVQVLFSLPEVQERYFATAEQTLEQCAADPRQDFEAQAAKLAIGLLSGEYSMSENPQNDENSICPRSFKTLVGKNHPDFSTNAQQDAMEYLLHLLSVADRSAHAAGRDQISRFFKFNVEERLQCTSSNMVRYSERENNFLFLPVDIKQAENYAEVEAYFKAWKEHDAANAAAEKKQPFKHPQVLAKLKLKDIIDNYFSPEAIEQWKSPATNEETTAIKQQRMSTFPRYLVMAMDKFYVDEDWTTKKKGLELQVPDELDLTEYRAKGGLQPGEQELPEAQEEAAAAAQEPQIDEAMVAQLASMGFDINGCRKAVMKNPNSIEAATEWVFQHMGDEDFSAPVQPAAQPSTSQEGPSDEALMMIESMGFTRDQARRALKATNNNVERAADWIFSHMDELNEPEPEEAGAAAGGAAAAAVDIPNHSGKYRLKAFISHSGNSTACGHYVCHIYKDRQWSIFNDSKVALSEDPPRDLGYMYIYESI